MPTVVFKTPGLIDIQSFTTFGINSKPKTDNPIGYFGTGLKYAIAVLVRLGIPVTVYIGNTPYVFYAKKATFRDKQFDIVRMKKANKSFGGITWSYYKLPFTTELGKNWTLWQVFRELEANTRDEKGETYAYLTDYLEQDNTGFTKIVVKGQDFYNVYEGREEIFLPEGLDLRVHQPGIRIFDKPSKHLYYRGLRVKDLENPSMFTYNFTDDVELTEDRTMKNEWYAKLVLSNKIVQCDDEVLIRKFVTASKETFEHSVVLDYTGVLPSETFKKVMKEVESNRKYRDLIRPTVSAYYKRYDYTPKPAPVTREELVQELILAIRDGNWDLVQELIEPNRERVIKMLKLGSQVMTEEAATSTSSPTLDEEIPF